MPVKTLAVFVGMLGCADAKPAPDPAPPGTPSATVTAVNHLIGGFGELGAEMKKAGNDCEDMARRVATITAATRKRFKVVDALPKTAEQEMWIEYRWVFEFQAQSKSMERGWRRCSRSKRFVDAMNAFKRTQARDSRVPGH